MTQCVLTYSVASHHASGAIHFFNALNQWSKHESHPDNSRRRLAAEGTHPTHSMIHAINMDDGMALAGLSHLPLPLWSTPSSPRAFKSPSAEHAASTHRGDRPVMRVCAIGRRCESLVVRTQGELYGVRWKRGGEWWWCRVMSECVGLPGNNPEVE